MSVQSEIDRIITAVGNAYSKVSEKGGTVPASQTVANLATAINSIPAGGGGGGVEEVDISFIKVVNISSYNGGMILDGVFGKFNCNFDSNSEYNFELSNPIPINEFFNDIYVVFDTLPNAPMIFAFNIIAGYTGQSGLLVKIQRA